MSDDGTKRVPQDGKRINMSEDYEVRYWTEKFRVSKEELARAVQAVGSTADAVEQHLKRGSARTA
ncbi:MAG: DUF3606 domain-containing protein [Burkholderiales bacterium]